MQEEDSGTRRRDRYTPRSRKGWPATATLAPDRPCPCGSGEPNASCHSVTRVLRLEPVRDPHPHPLLDTKGQILASEPQRYSSGFATVCNSCDAVLTVGLGIRRAHDLVLRCGCGAENAIERAIGESL